MEFGTSSLSVITDVFKIYGPIFQNIWPARYCVQNTLHDVWGRHEGVNDDNVDITTGVTTRFPMGFDGDQAGYDGIQSATHLGPRGVEGCRGVSEGCLGGHEEGASGVDEGVENASTLFQKLVRTALPWWAPSVISQPFQNGRLISGDQNISGACHVPRRRQRRSHDVTT